MPSARSLDVVNICAKCLQILLSHSRVTERTQNCYWTDRQTPVS